MAFQWERCLKITLAFANFHPILNLKTFCDSQKIGEMKLGVLTGFQNMELSSLALDLCSSLSVLKTCFFLSDLKRRVFSSGLSDLSLYFSSTIFRMFTHDVYPFRFQKYVNTYRVLYRVFYLALCLLNL